MRTRDGVRAALPLRWPQPFFLNTKKVTVPLLSEIKAVVTLLLSDLVAVISIVFLIASCNLLLSVPRSWYKLR